MLILLPPSETKAAGGAGAPLELQSLSFQQLTRVRSRLARSLQALARSPRKAAAVLGLGERQLDEVARNQSLLESPTMPAIERYTGVLYDSLDVRSIRGAVVRERALRRLAIGSALFGVVRASDPIPAYRLSAGTRLPRVGSLAPVWKPTLAPVLADAAEGGLVVDLRSGAYRALAPVAGALDVRVLTEGTDGSRRVVSHFNKATKGSVARILATSRRECASTEDVASLLVRGGFDVEQRGDVALDVVLRD